MASNSVAWHLNLGVVASAKVAKCLVAVGAGAEANLANTQGYTLKLRVCDTEVHGKLVLHSGYKECNAIVWLAVVS